MEQHHGKDGLPDMLKMCNFIVCVLPLDPSTEGLIDEGFLDQLPDGAVIINIGRGKHIQQQALIAALESGKLAGAFLDVFDDEPLPQEHVFWSHPKVFVTPHIAGDLFPESCAASVCDTIRGYIE